MMSFSRARRTDVESRERSAADPLMAVAGEVIDRFPGLWHHHRHLKYLRPIPSTEGGESCPARVIEIDWIVASLPEWEQSLERQEAGWDVTDFGDGLILAERTIG